MDSMQSSENNMKKKIVKVNLIIHIFALAHALTAILLRSMGAEDSIPLTILTIAMIIMISRLYDLPLDVTTALTIVCCFAGFYLGTKGAQIFVSVVCDKAAYLSNVFTTLVVTEAIGWITYFIAHKRTDVE